MLSSSEFKWKGVSITLKVHERFYENNQTNTKNEITNVFLEVRTYFLILLFPSAMLLCKIYKWKQAYCGCSFLFHITLQMFSKNAEIPHVVKWFYCEAAAGGNEACSLYNWKYPEIQHIQVNILHFQSAVAFFNRQSSDKMFCIIRAESSTSHKKIKSCSAMSIMHSWYVTPLKVFRGSQGWIGASVHVRNGLYAGSVSLWMYSK